MKIDPRLHHYAQQITSGTLESVLEMYGLLGCKVVYRPPGNKAWAMVGQEQLIFAIQIVEVDDPPITDLDLKRRTHMAFISDDPQGVVNKIKVWAEGKGVEFREGGWSGRERYYDLPDVFINFVVEVMHTSVEEE